jgi:glycosyltransferase involved in cell wall biosynthesis
VRIALICDWYAPRLGGIEAHLDALASRLTAAGHQIHVITSTPAGDGPSTNGIVVHRLDARRVPWAEVIFEPSAIRAIGEILVRERIELAHAHVSIVAPVGIGGAREAVQLHLPTVVTFHSFIPATPLWAWAVGRLVGADGWNATLTAVSSRVAHELRTFAPRSSIDILPNAIDAKFWSPPAQSPPRDHVALVAVGRLQAKKRPMLLIDTAREIRRVVPGVRFRFRIAGTGPLEKSMRHALARAHLDDVVELVGWRSPADLRALLRESDVMLSPAVRESFGLAALEARAVGLPVVAMRESAVTDFIRDEESGLLASSDAAFIRAAIRLVTDHELRARIAAHNRAVTPALDWTRSIAAHEAAYQRARQRTLASG